MPVIGTYEHILAVDIGTIHTVDQSALLKFLELPPFHDILGLKDIANNERQMANLATLQHPLQQQDISSADCPAAHHQAFDTRPVHHEPSEMCQQVDVSSRDDVVGMAVTRLPGHALHEVIHPVGMAVLVEHAHLLQFGDAPFTPPQFHSYGWSCGWLSLRNSPSHSSSRFLRFQTNLSSLLQS